MNYVYLAYLILGIFPLVLFIFSLIKPTKFTIKILPYLIFLLVALFFVRIGRNLLANYLVGKWIILSILIGFPPIAALLMALSGASAMADRGSPRLGIPLTILNAAGCTGLYVGLLLAYFYKYIVKGHGFGTDHIMYIKIIGGIETVVVLIYAFIIWKHRLIEERNKDGA